MGYERKRGIKDDFTNFDLTNQKDGIAIYWAGENCIGCEKGRNQQFSLGHVEIPIRDLSRDINLKVRGKVTTLCQQHTMVCKTKKLDETMWWKSVDEEERMSEASGLRQTQHLEFGRPGRSSQWTRRLRDSCVLKAKWRNYFKKEGMWSTKSALYQIRTEIWLLDLANSVSLLTLTRADLVDWDKQDPTWKWFQREQEWILQLLNEWGI